MPKTHTESQMKYDKEHRRVYGFRLHNDIDADIIRKLASVPNMQGYIKQLIREDIARTDSDSVPKMNMSLDDLYKFLQSHTEDYDGSMYELLNALTQKLMN